MRLSSWKVGDGLHHHCPPASPSPALDTRKELSENWVRWGERVSGSLEGACPALCLPFWLVLAFPTPFFYLGAPSAASASLFTPHFVLLCWVLWTLIFPPESLILSEPIIFCLGSCLLEETQVQIPAAGIGQESLGASDRKPSSTWPWKENRLAQGTGKSRSGPDFRPG